MLNLTVLTLTIGLHRVNGEFSNWRQSGILLAEYTVQVLKFISVLYFINYNRSTNGQIKYICHWDFIFLQSYACRLAESYQRSVSALCLLIQGEIFGLLDTLSNLSIPWISVITVHGVITPTKCTILINTTHYWGYQHKEWAKHFT
jgi:hypothetical protein